MDRVSRSAQAGHFLFQATESTIPAVMSRLSQNQSAEGTVLVGSDIAIRSLTAPRIAGPVFVDFGGWRSAIASPAGTLALDLAASSADLDLNSYVELLSAKGFTRVLAPTLAIGARDIASLHQTVNRMRGCELPAFVPYLVVHASFLAGSNFLELRYAIHALLRPVALTVLGGSAAIATPERLSNLRTLVEEGLVAHVLAADPIIASDSIVRGAETVSVGLMSGMRIPVMPGAQGPRSDGWLPGLFSRGILETRSPRRIADWYAGSPAGLDCDLCGYRGFDSYSSHSAADIIAISEHNLHAFGRFFAEVKEVPTELAPIWMRDERLRALDNHPLGPIGADAILSTYVGLDGSLDAYVDLAIS